MPSPQQLTLFETESGLRESAGARRLVQRNMVRQLVYQAIID